MPDMTLWNVLKSKLFLLFFEMALSLIMLNKIIIIIIDKDKLGLTFVSVFGFKYKTYILFMAINTYDENHIRVIIFGMDYMFYYQIGLTFDIFKKKKGKEKKASIVLIDVQGNSDIKFQSYTFFFICLTAVTIKNWIYIEIMEQFVYFIRSLGQFLEID